MPPIHESDIAENRWSEKEWNHYELWEKIEVRLRRRKRLWIGGTILFFLCLASIPVIQERLPKWSAMAANRRLAQKVNSLKTLANQNHASYRIVFGLESGLDYRIQKVSSCKQSGKEIEGEIVESGRLNSSSQPDSLKLLSPEQGNSFSLASVVNSFCYDYLVGSEAMIKNQDFLAFVIMPANDLTEKRLDRLSVLMLGGQLAEISFD